MGSFAKSLANLLFGWVSDVFSRIWSLFTTDSGTESIPWIGKQWILIVVVLCVLGLLIDFSVYLYRWKPYKVWASFFRNRRNPDAEYGQMSEAYATAAEQAASVPEEEAEEQTEQPLREPPAMNYQWTERETPVYESASQKNRQEADVTETRRELPEQADPYASYRRPVTESVRETRDGYERKTDTWQTGPATERNERQARYRRTPPQETRRRRIVRNLLGDEDSGDLILPHSSRPAPMIDREEAYNEPVYPPQWKQNRQSGENDTHDQ